MAKGKYLGDFEQLVILAVMRLGDEVRQPISVIPTGSIALDVALGIGGLPTDAEWKIIEKYVGNYCKAFGLEARQTKLLRREKFTRLFAKSSRPYGRMYAY